MVNGSKILKHLVKIEIQAASLKWGAELAQVYNFSKRLTTNL